jgi:ABC-type transport system involved in multi-copper enzyme maturation permease subunit
MTSFSTTPIRRQTFRVLVGRELISARRFYPVFVSMLTVNLGLAIAAPILGQGLGTTVDILSLMMLLTSYTAMGFSVSSFAEDKQDGTLELLLTCPVTKRSLLLAKLAIGMVLAIPLALVPYGLSAVFLLKVPASTVAGLAIGSLFASLTATSVALLTVVLVKRTEVGVYLGFMVAWILTYTPTFVLSVPVLKFLIPGYFIRDTFLKIGDQAIGPVILDLTALAALTAFYLLVASWTMEREDAVLTAA